MTVTAENVSWAGWCDGCGDPHHKCWCDERCATCACHEHDHDNATRRYFNANGCDICDQFTAPSQALIEARRTGAA
jgi:hypothetical protein